MPKVFDLTLLTQKTAGKDTAGKVYNYFWKTFDFRNGRTLETVQDEHPYSKDPVNSISKSHMQAGPLAVEPHPFCADRPIVYVVPPGRRILFLQ